MCSLIIYLRMSQNLIKVRSTKKWDNKFADIPLIFIRNLSRPKLSYEMLPNCFVYINIILILDSRTQNQIVLQICDEIICLLKTFPLCSWYDTLAHAFNINQAKWYFKHATHVAHLLQYYLSINLYNYLHWVVVSTNVWYCVFSLNFENIIWNY